MILCALLAMLLLGSPVWAAEPLAPEQTPAVQDTPAAPAEEAAPPDLRGATSAYAEAGKSDQRIFRFTLIY